MLFRMFHPNSTQIRHVVFSDIMPQLKAMSADFGVCIHEGRFTWQDEGLGLVEDLGTRWETETSTPLPLGGIVARRSLPDDVIERVQAVLLDSLTLALNDPNIALPTMRKYAQEFDDRVLMQHVELYVNDWTVDLGDVGDNALKELSRRAKAIGLVPYPQIGEKVAVRPDEGFGKSKNCTPYDLRTPPRFQVSIKSDSKSTMPSTIN
jgi:1,4-dihydroxy-6-naphthoate synthase